MTMGYYIYRVCIVVNSRILVNIYIHMQLRNKDHYLMAVQESGPKHS